MTPQAFSIDTLLERVATEDASDLHVTAGVAAAAAHARPAGPLEEFEPFTPEETRDLLYRVLSTDQQKRLEIDRQIDFSYSVPGVARFRVNVYFQRDTPRGRLPPRAEADQVGRGARPPRGAPSARARAARPRPRDRPDRLR